MAKAPPTSTSRAKVTPAPNVPAHDAPAPDAPAPDAPAAGPAQPEAVPLFVIRMLVGQEGPEISRARGQELTIGEHIDADEAQRLIDVDFAERA